MFSGPCNISTKETYDRGETYHEGNRCDGSGRGAGAVGSVVTQLAREAGAYAVTGLLSITGHELAGVVTAPSYGTMALSVDSGCSASCRRGSLQLGRMKWQV